MSRLSLGLSQLVDYCISSRPGPCYTRTKPGRPVGILFDVRKIQNFKFQVQKRKLRNPVQSETAYIIIVAHEMLFCIVFLVNCSWHRGVEIHDSCSATGIAPAMSAFSEYLPFIKSVRGYSIFQDGSDLQKHLQASTCAQ